MSGNLERVVGTLADDPLGDGWWAARLHPDDRDHVLSQAPELLAEGQITRDYRFRHQDGTYRWIHDEQRLLRDATGRGVEIVGSWLDVTDRRRAEDTALDLERRYQTIFAASPLPMWVFDMETLRFLDVNAAALRHYGFTRDEFLAMTILDIQRSEEGEAVRRRRATVSGVGGATPAQHRRKDGSLIDVEVAAEDTEVGGRPARIAVVWDVTERKRAEAERARLAMAVEQAGESIVVTDPEGTILYVNPAFERISGYTREEAQGCTPRMLRSGTHDPAFYRELWGTLTRGEAWQGRFVNRAKDGTLHEEEATISPVRDAGGQVVNYVSVQRDLTREKRLEDQLRQSQKMEAVGQLAGGVAHDFNNILGVITGYGEMLAREASLGPAARRRVAEVRRAADQAAGLTRQLLAFSREQRLQPKVLDVNVVLMDVERMLHRLIGEHIRLRTTLAHDLGHVHADPGQVEQVIVNLAVNARDAMPGGGSLTIETADVDLDAAYAGAHPGVRPGPYVQLTVSDTGVGMDEVTLNRIFEPFFTTKEPGKGTGLGLATVYGIVKQSGGHVTVDSAPGRGSMFRVYLPRVEACLDPGPRDDTAPLAPTGGETILLAEDAEALRLIIREILESAGYHVLDHGDPLDALAVARAPGARVHLLLTDLVMPGMGGRDLAQAVRRARPGIRILFMSGYAEGMAGPQGMLEGGAPVLEKPFSGDLLLRRVREVLDRVEARATTS